MQIRFLNRLGVPHAEVEAHQQIQTAFSRSTFARRWRGYASFKLARPGRGAGDDDFDLVLVTHAQIFVIELKNWRGKTLSYAGGRWYVDGRDMGPSPAETVNLKAKKLASVMRQKLGHQKTPFIASLVVIQGVAEFDLESEPHHESVMFLEEFVRCADEHQFRRWFPRLGRFDPTDLLSDYDAFFAGRDFKPRDYVVHGFRPGDAPIWQHPRKLFAEFKATAVDSSDQYALLRQWDFRSLGPTLIGEGDRAFIALREQRIFEYVADRNESLSLCLLRPVVRSEDRDVVADFVELYKLPSRLTRLTEFANSALPRLDPPERLGLAKVLVNGFADLHDLGIAHRDLGQHSIWIERPARIVLSGFSAAHYPSLQTIGAHAHHVRVGRDIAPEDASAVLAGTPYQRDVFLLGVQCHLLFFGELPPKREGVIEWLERATDQYDGRLNAVLSKALAHSPSQRYANAREMLNALNDAAEVAQAEVVDLTRFESFRARSRANDYPEEFLIRDDDDCAFYRSSRDGRAVSVKVWHSVEPDAKQPDACIGLMTFLEKARTLASAQVKGLPAVIDVGLTRRSLLLVTEWIEGHVLPQWLARVPDLAGRLAVARRLVDTVTILHQRDIVHGDVHPQNILIDENGSPILIDVLDLARRGEDRYTTGYLPHNFRELSPFDRDRYGIAAVIRDLFVGIRSESTDVPWLPSVSRELQRLLTETAAASLEPLQRVLEQASQSDPETPTFVFDAHRQRPRMAVGPLLADNGSFHVRVELSQKLPNALFFRLTGVGVVVNFDYRPTERDVPNLWIQAVPPWQLARSQSQRDATIKVAITLVDTETPSDEPLRLAQQVLALPGVMRRVERLGVGTGSTETPAHADRLVSGQAPAPSLGPELLWSSLLEAEEEALTTLTVTGAPHSSDGAAGRILQIPYRIDSGEMEEPSEGDVDVEHLNSDGVWRRCGRVEFEDTTLGNHPVLAVAGSDTRAHMKVGDVLRLRSGLERVSFSRRSDAVQRILKGNAVIGDLVRYFDEEHAASIAPTRYPEPTDEDLDRYSLDGRALNDSQRDAFRKVIGNGPISLVQGPPGTGKTWFIASLLHYLVTVNGARRILVVSQSHEAVNNALEKAVELFRLTGDSLDAVRLGGELLASDAIQHLHAASIERGFRETFKAERMPRLIGLATDLGLPRAFTEDMVALWSRLGSLRDRIHALRKYVEVSESSMEDTTRATQVESLENTFRTICADVYGVQDAASLDDAISLLEVEIAQRHEVYSTDLVERLRRLYRLSNDWVGALGSDQSNFAEFLAKSRTIVADTLVGIGRRTAGVVQNEHDWVVVDEAARAASSELAVAIQAGRRLLLVGDHKQLPPTYSDEVEAAMRRRFAVPDDDDRPFISEFERMYASAYGAAVGASLSRQYRMAPSICRVVSECFYEGQLTPERGEAPEWYRSLPPHIQKEVTWLDTATLGPQGVEQDRGEGRITNDGEAHVVMTVLRQIVETDGFVSLLEKTLGQGQPGIGIICAYAAQRDLLERRLSEATWLGESRRLVKVDTVDGYQGKENRIVIVSTVRNNPRGKSGFLKSLNRINVALSRAMDRLIVVGSSSMWSTPRGVRPLERVYSLIAEMASSGEATLVSAKDVLEWRR
jgi:serine/threonine protein kinase